MTSLFLIISLSFFLIFFKNALHYKDHICCFLFLFSPEQDAKYIGPSTSCIIAGLWLKTLLRISRWQECSIKLRARPSVTALDVFCEAGPMVPDALSKTLFFKGYRTKLGSESSMHHEYYIYSWIYIYIFYIYIFINIFIYLYLYIL